MPEAYRALAFVDMEIPLAGGQNMLAPRVEARVRENHKAPFTYDPAVLDLVAQRCAELERGARVVETLINNAILPEVGREFLRRLTLGKTLGRIHVEARDGEFLFCYD